MRHFLQCLAIYFAAALVAILLAVVAIQLWDADLDVPLGLDGDNWMNLAWTQGIADQGWYLRNDRLGAPHEMDLRDFPMTDVWHFACLKGFILLGCSAALAVNLYFLAGFPLTAVSALFVLRRWGVTLVPAFVVAQLFAVMPFHFRPGQAHLFLSSYYLLPLMIGMTLRVWRDGGPRSRGEWVGTVMLCLFAGASGIYYAFYTCFFLLVAAGACAWRQRRFRPLFNGAVLIALLSGCVAACTGPTLAHHYQHLDNPLVGRRYPFESMRFGLHFARLFTPVNDHYLPLFADFRRRYDMAMMPYPTTENNRSSLGVIACAGLLYLLVRLLAPRQEREPLPDDGLTLFSVTGLLLGVTGGGAVLFALLINPSLRAHARLNALLAFFALFAVALLLTRLECWMRSARARVAFYTGAALLLTAGFLDQTGWAIVLDHAEYARQWRHDEDYFAEVEGHLSAGDCVFCLPVLSYPEARHTGRMRCCYEQLRGYVHTRQTRWSYGAIRNRYAGVWHERLTDVHGEELLDVLCLSGFAGVLIDRAGYSADHESDLACALACEPLVSPNGRLAFYPLAEYLVRLRARLSAGEWHSAVTKARTPILATWHGEASGDEEGTRWIGRSACVVLHNPTGTPRRASLRVRFERALPGRRSPRLQIKGDGWSVKEKVPLDGWVFEREVVLAPGENRIWIHARGAERDRLLCPRRAVACIRGFDLVPDEPPRPEQ